MVYLLLIAIISNMIIKTMGDNLRRFPKIVKQHPRSDYVLLGALVLAIFTVDLIWRHIELRPPHWDMGRHLLNSLHYLDLFKSHSLSILDAYYYYPPLVYWVAIPFQILFHPSIESAVASNIVFISTLVYATYELGKYLWGRRTGLLAAFLTLTTPMLVTQFKEFQIDGPLTAITALSLLFLLKSEKFTNHKYSLLFGASFGMGMFTKWTFPFIMAAPLALIIIQSAISLIKSRNGKILYNAVAAAVITYAIAGVWYVTNFWKLRIDLAQNSTAAGMLEGDPVIGTFASNIWHIINLTDNYLRLATILFMVGLVYLCMRRKNFVRNIYPLLLVVGSILFFTMLRNKDARYIAPVMPAVAIICVYWFDQVRAKWRNVLGISVLVYGALVFWSISFGVPFLPKNLAFQAGGQNMVLFDQRGYLIGAPTRENWHQEEVIEYVSTQSGGKVLRYYGKDTIYFNSWGLWYYCDLHGVALDDFEQDPKQTQKPDYILTRIVEGGMEAKHEGSLVRSYLLPDGSVLRLYKVN